MSTRVKDTPPMSQASQPQPPDERILVELAIPAESSLGREEALRVARESFYVELYRLGVIGSGRAATLLGVDRSTFLDLLSEHGVSWWDDTMDVAQEDRNALPWR
jgi:predicted HTH domain antitoxin